MQISADLPPALMPLAWLLGTWEGVGVGTGVDGEFQYGERLSFAHDGRDFVSYDTSVWLLDEAGEPGEPQARETGYWRLGEGGALEVLVAHATGIAEIYAGQVEGPRIEIATDLVGRTATGVPYTAGRRLYGQVEGDLLYAYDAAFDGSEVPGLAPLRAARLRRTS